MPYIDLVTFEAAVNASLAGAAKIDDDYTLIVYSASGVINTRVITNSGTAGAVDTVSLTLGVSEISVCQLTPTLYVATWTDVTTVKAAPIGVSGTTATFGTVSTVETSSSAAPTPQVCKLGTNKALVIYASLSGGTTYNIRASTLSGVTGSALTVNTVVTLATTTGSVIGTYLTPSVCYVDSNAAHIVWGNGSGVQYAGLVSSASTTPSLTDSGTFPNITDHTPQNTTMAVAAVDTNKSLCGWFEEDGANSLQKLYAAVLTDNGTTITVNTPVLIASWNPSSVTAVAYVSALSTTQSVLWYKATTMQALIIGIASTTPSLSETISDETESGIYSTNVQSLTAIGAAGFGGVRQGSGILFAYVASGLRFYSGTNTLTQRAYLALTSVKRGGLLIKSDDSATAVVASGNATDTVIVQQSDSTSTYGTWSNITGTHGAGPVESIKEI